MCKTLSHVRQSFASPAGPNSVMVAVVKPKSEEFLNYMLWAFCVLGRPTFRNLTDSYEAWAYRTGFRRQLNTLHRSGYLDSGPPGSDRLYRLTRAGRLHALGGRDPDEEWNRKWDKKWRLILFDVPIKFNSNRTKLRRYLGKRGLGCLQGSVWVTPHPISNEQEILSGSLVNVNSLLLLEARPCAGESDLEIVLGAWDFDEINSHYEDYLELLERIPVEPLKGTGATNKFQTWAREEREAWLAAIEKDPLLPRQLLPEGYLGCHAWQKRKKTMCRAMNLLNTFQPN